MDYLLSVVIPTRNRQEYAIKSVKQCLSVTDSRVQIIVSDNSDDNSLQPEIEALNESRVKYQFIDKRIPGVDNYANGIAMCEGEYICCIGDDDGIITSITDITEWAKENNIPAIKPGVHAGYIWPNVVEYYKNGCLSLNEVSATYYHVDVKKELVKFLHTGCDDLPNAQLPKAYHGIIRKDLFDKIKEKTGRYCGGLSPDIYLSISLSLLLDDLLCIDIPLTIFGACKASTTGDSLNKINKGKLEDAPHFVGQPYVWSSKVPRFYCGSNIWADSALHALEEMGADDMMDEFSVEQLSCYGLLAQKLYREEIMENFEKNGGDKKLLKQLIRKEYPAHILRTLKAKFRTNKLVFGTYKILRSLYQKDSKAFSRPDVMDIAQAERIVTDTIGAEVAKLIVVLKESGAK